MNTLTRLVAGLVTTAVAVMLLFFLTTVGLILAAVVGIALFVGALSLRGKGRETQVGGFRVITFGSQPFGSQQFGEKPFDEQGGQPRAGEQKQLDDVVDLSPEDYKPVESSSDDKAKNPKN